jgi:hypothetical protein
VSGNHRVLLPVILGVVELLTPVKVMSDAELDEAIATIGDWIRRKEDDLRTLSNTLEELWLELALREVKKRED